VAETGGGGRCRHDGIIIDLWALPPLSYLPMDFPDLAPWFDNASDDYVEVVSADVDVAYDE